MKETKSREIADFEDAEVSEVDDVKGAAEVIDDATSLCETLYDYHDDEIVRTVKEIGLKLEGVERWLRNTQQIPTSADIADIKARQDLNDEIEESLLEFRSKLHLLWRPFYDMLRGDTGEDLATIRVERNGKEYGDKLGHRLTFHDAVAYFCLIDEMYKKATELYAMH